MSKSNADRKRKAVELATRFTPPAGRVLEVSCGAGGELLKLQQAGFQVEGTNFTKYTEESPGIPVKHGVDLLKGLPFAAESFDTVILLDVIEHLANHDQALAELARVCKRDGHVILMTPNIMKLTSRVQFLFTGFFKLKRAFIGFDVPQGSSFTFHNYPVHVPVFLYQLRAAGLRLADVSASVYKAKSFLFYALLWPFVAVATVLALRGEKNLKGTPAARELWQALNSVAGLCGEFLFFVARKQPVAPAATTALPTWSEKWEK